MKNIDDFVNEITANFSELFVETFFLRYLSDFDKNDLLENAKLVKEKLNLSLEEKMKNKLLEFGINENDII